MINMKTSHKPSQKKRLLHLLLTAPDNSVTCLMLVAEYLYHSAAKRVHELRNDGWKIKFIQGHRPMTGKYILER